MLAPKLCVKLMLLHMKKNVLNIRQVSRLKYDFNHLFFKEGKERKEWSHLILKVRITPLGTSGTQEFLSKFVFIHINFRQWLAQTSTQTKTGASRTCASLWLWISETTPRRHPQTHIEKNHTRTADPLESFQERYLDPIYYHTQRQYLLWGTVVPWSASGIRCCHHHTSHFVIIYNNGSSPHTLWGQQSSLIPLPRGGS